MFRKEVLAIAITAAFIFVAVGSMGWYAVLQLNRASTALVEDTLPGLIDAGIAAERMHDNRHNMKALLEPGNNTNRAQIIAQVQANSTDKIWAHYQASIFQVEDLRNYQALMTVRKAYLDDCDQFFKLAAAGKTQEAATLFDGELSLLFQRYNDSAKALFNYNVDEGAARAEIIRRTSGYAALSISILTVLAFLFGFVLGLRQALIGQLGAVRLRRKV